MKYKQKPKFFIKGLEKLWGISHSYLSQPQFKKVRKATIFIVGFTVLLIGIAMIILPGPAVIVIPFGLAILGTEFLWARRLLHQLKRKTSEIKDSVQAYRHRSKK